MGKLYWNIRIIKLYIIGYAQIRAWQKRSFRGQSPDFIKRSFICSYSGVNSIWVESGTYLGDTSVALSRSAKKVYTIEPAAIIARRARARFKKYSNIELIEGTSESEFENILKKVDGDVCFFLDGHASGGITYLGSEQAPIIHELNSISKNIENFNSIKVIVDDVRLFDSCSDDLQIYPRREYLVSWAVENRLEWIFLHDMFIAESKSL